MSETDETVVLDYKMRYEEYIQENNLDVKKFPASIGKKIRTLKMLVGKYNANPSPAWKENIIKTDIDTSNLIMQWVQEDYPDEVIDPAPTPENFEDFEGGDNPPAPAPEGGEAPAAKGGDNPPPAPAPAPAPAPEGGEAPAAKGGDNPPPAPAKSEIEIKAEEAAQEEAARKAEATAKIEAMEKKIMENINGNRIKAHILKDIIGQTPETPIQQVGKLKLKKVFLFDGFELI